MKRTLYIALCLAALTLIVSGCDKYLNRQPDDQLTSESIFEKANTTLQYLVNVYTYLPVYSSAPYGDQNGVGFTMRESASDETSSSYTGNGRLWYTYLHGQMSPSITGNAGSGYYTGEMWNYPYKGIREATYFMQNVDKCPEYTESEKKEMAAEARFLRAYYYFELLQWNGPVILIGDDMADFNDPDIANVDRTDWMTIVNWCCDEFDAAAAILPVKRSGSMLGRATKAMALAAKAKLLLFSARPLFNGQNGTHIYDNIKNKDGVKIFCTEYDETKWQRAAEACKAVIDLEGYSLEWNDNGTVSCVKNYHNIFERSNTSAEILFPKQEGPKVRQNTLPKGFNSGKVNGWGGVALTQKAVDRFACKNGYYPIKNVDQKNYKNGVGTIEIDERANYTETGHTDFVNPYWAEGSASKKHTAAVGTMNMYVDREPRFYANVHWSRQPVIVGSVENTTRFYTGGADGYMTTDQNYPTTGYLPLKFHWPDMDGSSSNWGWVCWPVIRLADIYLAYIECLNEYDPTNADILKYWNMIRHRAGIPGIGDGNEDTELGWGLSDMRTVYPEIIGDKALQRKYIRQERTVELCFEAHRYIDDVTWMTAVDNLNGPVGGCNIKATNDNLDGDYWARTSIFDCYGEGTQMAERSFKTKDYLVPLNQSELNRLPLYTQNYGW